MKFKFTNGLLLVLSVIYIASLITIMVCVVKIQSQPHSDTKVILIPTGKGGVIPIVLPPNIKETPKKPNTVQYPIQVPPPSVPPPPAIDWEPED